MENEVKQRLIDFLRYKNLSQCKFERACGLSNGYINNLKKSIGTEKLQNIIGAFPDLNIEWLLYGEGEMIKTQPFTAINNGTNNGVVGYNSGTINNTATPTIEEVDAEVIPYVDTALARKRNFNIAKAINNDSELLKQRTLDELFAPISFIIKMYDNSMMDEIRQGDLLFVKFIPKDANIISGKIYLIDTNSYGTLVRQVYVSESSFTLHAFNPSYEDIIITRDDIFNFCMVEHSLRSSFVIPDNTISTIAKESTKQVTILLSEARKERDRQDKLTDFILNNLKK